MNKYKLADVLIIGRGGGSLEDLWPFNEEILARTIFNSEIPIISAVGHDTDYTISDFVSDLRAPTPSAAAELAVPNIDDLKKEIDSSKNRLRQALLRKLEALKLRYQAINNKLKSPINNINENRIRIDHLLQNMLHNINMKILNVRNDLNKSSDKLEFINPLNILDRGYVLIEKDGKMIKEISKLKKGDLIEIRSKEDKKKAEIK